MGKQVPLVEYLALEPEPHLVANECTQCGARFFDRRNACASCENDQWKQVDIATTGEVKAFTIVSMAAPGVPVPFIAAVVDCDGTSVRGNILGVEPDADNLSLGMKVELTTSSVGTDSEGTEAVGYGFRPIS
jgi:uncharacterized OB-fold protein